MLNPRSKSKRPEFEAAALPADPVFAEALDAIAAGRSSVLASIVGVQGSSPREVGARMLITRTGIAGSVGGGVLEHMVIQRARTLIGEAQTRHCLLSFPLGPDSQQCCGGVVTLFLEPLSRTDQAWLEPLDPDRLRSGIGILSHLGEHREKKLIDPAPGAAVLPPGAGEWLARRAGPDARLFQDGEREFLCQYLAQPGFDVALFGAGHVGRAIVTALASQCCRVLWVDPRSTEFPDPMPANTRALVTDDVDAAMTEVPPGALVLVMTHRHPLDYEICRTVLERGDCAFLGLIGSATKRRRFAKALLADGVDQAAIESLHCPIGIPGLRGKEPPVIAASAVAQLLIVAEETRPSDRAKIAGIRERDAERSCVAASF